MYCTCNYFDIFSTIFFYFEARMQYNQLKKGTINYQMLNNNSHKCIIKVIPWMIQKK